MKKILAVAALALLGFSSSALAQPFSPAAPPYEVSASGSVANALQVYEFRGMNLGTINNNGLGITKTVAATDASNAAFFGVAGDANDNVTITGMSASLAHVAAPGQVVAPGQVTTLTGTGFDVYAQSDVATASFSDVTSATFALSGTPGVTPIASFPSLPASYGWANVFVGCDFVVSPNQQQGAYTGTVAISAAY